MLAKRGVRHICPECTRLLNHPYVTRSRNGVTATQNPSWRSVQSYSRPLLRSCGSSVRWFGTSRSMKQQAAPKAADTTDEDMEKIVRDAKQRFRDTLPKGYLSDTEYQLYERLFGPPLRETAPEDVGIPEHADMNPSRSTRKPSDQGTALRQLESGDFEEVAYQINRDVQPDLTSETYEPSDVDDPASLMNMRPSYVDAVARNERERKVLQELQRDFELAQDRQQEEMEAIAAAEAEAATQALQSDDVEWFDEVGHQRVKRVSGAEKRFHEWTLKGKFHDSPVEILLPRQQLVQPISTLLGRSHLDHVRAAAEAAFGGAGLPTSPATPESKKAGHMGGVGLPPDSRHMTEIEADAFLAAFMPPAYASVLSVLREVRKRMGGDWLQSKLKNGEDNDLQVLDSGTGGAALLAWEQIVNAEWEVLKEKGEVTGANPPGKKTVVVSSDRLRHRVKDFLHNTSILPRLPDYVHSGEMKSGQQHIDAGSSPQPRKKYDIVIASHLFLKQHQEFRRKELMENLWTMVKEDGGILVVIEKAHPRGFEAMAEVRDTLLSEYLLPQGVDTSTVSSETQDSAASSKRRLEPGHIIAPCPNQTACPMYKIPGKSPRRKDYCHFSQRFVRPNFYVKMLGDHTTNSGEVEFSYFAAQRGVAKPEAAHGDDLTEQAFKGYQHATSQPDFQSLPRIVLPSLKRTGHVTMDVCTPKGSLERWTVPKSFSKLAYHDARKSSWGDLWALGAKTRTPRSLRLGNGATVPHAIPTTGRRVKNVDEKVKREKFRQKSRKAQSEEMVKAERLEHRRQNHAEMVDEINDDLQAELDMETMEAQVMRQVAREDGMRRSERRGGLKRRSD